MTALADIFSQLKVPRDKILFLHSSMDWMGRAGIKWEEVLSALLDWIGDRGTVAILTCPFIRGHEDYLSRKPHFDVRTTPTLMGLLSEWIRRSPASLRSLDPDLTVSAIGSEAGYVVGNRPTGEIPHASDSPFHRVLASGGALIGLGVTTNYMIMTHVLDARFRNRYHFPVYSSRTFEATVTDREGKTATVWKRAVPSVVETNIKPGKQVSLLPEGSPAFRSVSVGGAQFFRWELAGWEELCTRHIEERLDRGGAPCWHEAVAGESSRGLFSSFPPRPQEGEDPQGVYGDEKDL